MAGETTEHPLNNGATPAPIPTAVDPDTLTTEAEIDLSEGVEEPVVEVTEGEPEPAAAAPAAKPNGEAAPKPKFKAKEAPDALLGRKSYEARHYKSEAERLAAESRELMDRLTATEARSQHIDQSALAIAERAATAELNLAKREYADATAVNDVNRIAEAAQKMTSAANDLASINQVKASKPAPAAAAPAPVPLPQPAAPAPAAPQVPEPLANWLTDNPWAVRGNALFDQDMASHLAGSAQTIEARYQRQGKSNLIGSPEYFNDIDAEMQREFPDRFEGVAPTPQPSKKATPPKMTKATPAVAPAAGNQPPAATNAAPTKVNLSADERNFAIRMAANGALSFPYGHPKFGQRPNEQEAQVLFAKSKLADMQNPQRQRGR